MDSFLSRLRRSPQETIKIVAALIVTYVLVSAAIEHRSQVMSAIEAIPTINIVIGFIFVLCGTLLGVEAWFVTLRGMHLKAPRLNTYSINLVGQLGKYIPGSIWGYVFQIELAKKIGIPRPKTFINTLIFIAITIITGTAVGAGAYTYAKEINLTFGWIFLLPLFGIPFLNSKILSKTVNFLLMRLSKAPLSAPIGQKAINKSCFFAVLAWVMLGYQSYILISPFVKLSTAESLFLISVTAIAMVAGQLAFFLPSGIGVREAILMAGFQRYVSFETALAISLISRALFTSADIFLAGVFWAISSWLNRFQSGKITL